MILGTLFPHAPILAGLDDGEMCSYKHGHYVGRWDYPRNTSEWIELLDLYQTPVLLMNRGGPGLEPATLALRARVWWSAEGKRRDSKSCKLPPANGLTDVKRALL